MPTREDRAHAPLRVVGIGASAGGLEAVSRLLARLSPGTGLSFVLVQHLDPDRPSQLPEILSRSTTMRVSAAVDGAPLVADEILIAPPHALVGVRAGCLAIHPSPADGSPFLPIDTFFQAIADEFHDGAAGIVLSGTGSDGAAGLAAIRAGGGLAIAQAPASAQFPAMPNAAIEAGVDLVLAPEEIADTLSGLRGVPGDSFRREAGPGDDLGPVLDTLRTVRGRDFSRYKRGTVERRIRRRMALLKLETVEDYARHLAENRSEQDALCEDLLIKVTRFFREPEGLDQLKTFVFPRLAQDKGPGEPIRIWVPGCATGEEAFSIAICMTEFLASRHLARTVHIFATDVSREAIDKARSGHFGTEVEATVSAGRLETFFVKSDKGYQIAKSIREMCVFAEQDVTRDPPFSRMDLISCRNLLIYFGDALQRQVLSTFHFALNPSGFLLLGNAESIGQAAELFAATGKGSRVFSRRLVPSRTPDFAFERATGKASREGPPVLVRKFSPADALKSEADHAIADNFALDGVVIDEHMEILQFRGHTEPFLAHRPGEHASFHLFKMARDGLLVDLRLAIFEAQATNRPVRRDHVRIARSEDATTFEAAIQVLPFRAQSTGQNYFVVLFEKVASVVEATAADESPEGQSAATIAMLQRELAETKQYLNSLIEKEQASNEELKTASEEILSSNEELQSTNEELQTAKQETEATNEELTTVNDELRHRNAELARVHGDLANLVSAAQASVLILEKDFTCRSLTPDAERLLNLASSAIGRPLDELVAGFRTPDIRKRAEEVLETLSPHEFETQDQAGRWYGIRIRPYRTLDNKIDGVAMAIRDVDPLKSAVLRLEAARDYADAIVATVPVPLLVLDRDRRVVGANPALLRTFRIADLQAPIPLDRLAGGD